MLAYTHNFLHAYRRKTHEVTVGDIIIGGQHKIVVQSMTTTPTKDTQATVDQIARLIDVGCQIVRITTPNLTELENTVEIRKEMQKRNLHVPLVADVHFQPKVALRACELYEKVRINPGNFADKKAFNMVEYTDAAYQEELDRIYDTFLPLLNKAKENGVALRIGTNHGSLSDRIMSRYGDTPLGMVESAMEFLRIAKSENFHNIVLSMKASNPMVMIQAYRLLVSHMQQHDMHYPLHLGVTEAGDGEDGRIKSAMGIGSLLADGLGDTIRVSLTEDPEHEIPVAKALLALYERPIATATQEREVGKMDNIIPSWDMYQYHRHASKNYDLNNISYGHKQLVRTAVGHLHEKNLDLLNDEDYPIEKAVFKLETINDKNNHHAVMQACKEANVSRCVRIQSLQMQKLGVQPEDYDELSVMASPVWAEKQYADKLLPMIDNKLLWLRFEWLSDVDQLNKVDLEFFAKHKVGFEVRGHSLIAMVRKLKVWMDKHGIQVPLHLVYVGEEKLNKEATQLKAAVELGALLCEGLGDSVEVESVFGAQFNRDLCYLVLQASRLRMTKTDYIACPSCGRTLFDLQETTARIRSKTGHLKGLKIAIMGCIVNGPGEMADADFGYVGSGPGHINLYVGKECVKRSIPSEKADEELIALIKAHDKWIEPRT